MNLKYKDWITAPHDEVLKVATSLSSYVAEVRTVVEKLDYSAPEGSLAVPHDKAMLQEVVQTAARLGDQLKVVVVVGIGGSDLGARAVYDALFSRVDMLDPVRLPKLIFLESVEPEVLERIDAHIGELVVEPQHIAVVVASKSGTTTESRTNAAIVCHALEERFGPVARDRVVVVTDASTALAEDARHRGVQVLVVPDNVVGRYSVFSASGLLPIALAGVNVESFAAGGRNGIAAATAADMTENPAALLASLLFVYANAGIRMHDIFLFHPELETLGKWYRQLLAESVGKRQEGTEKRVGITPVVAIGTTDLHSLIQLVFAGPRERFTTFVAAPDAWGGPTIPSSDDSLLRAPKALAGKAAGAINAAIYEGVKRAYRNEGLPCSEIVLKEISAHEIGRFMVTQMAAIMYLAKLFGVNAFDQPAVETYKEEVRKLLEDN